MHSALEQLDARIFESYWPISSVRLGEKLPGYEGRSVGVIDSDQGRFVYKLIPWRAGHDGEDINRSAYVLDFLEERNVHVAPHVLHAKSGERTVEVGQSTLMLIEHIEGDRPVPTAKNYRRLGQLVGQLNAITDYPNRCPITLEGVRIELREKTASRLGSASRREFVDLATQLAIPDSLPDSLIHTELNLANAIQRPDATIIGVDWDEAGTGPRVYDPAAPLISVFASEDLRFDETGAKAFYEGYGERVQLSKHERNGLFDVALLIAMRYVSWGDSKTRWRRVQWAIKHKDRLLSAVFG
jgi:Ser/Thr protein kinase RdoA (MazF antagonist)